MNHSLLFYIKNFLLVMVNPDFWIKVRKVDSEWDKVLNRLMENGYEPYNISNYTCEIAGQEIWISNYPYGYGNPYGGIEGNRRDRDNERIPYALTRYRLKRYLRAYQEAKEEEERKKRGPDATERAVERVKKALSGE